MTNLQLLKNSRDDLYKIYKNENSILKNYKAQEPKNFELIEKQKAVVTRAKIAFVLKHNEYVTFKKSLNLKNDTTLIL